jgi:hypothetical protein
MPEIQRRHCESIGLDELRMRDVPAIPRVEKLVMDVCPFTSSSILIVIYRRAFSSVSLCSNIPLCFQIDCGMLLYEYVHRSSVSNLIVSHHHFAEMQSTVVILSIHLLHQPLPRVEFCRRCESGQRIEPYFIKRHKLQTGGSRRS